MQGDIINILHIENDAADANLIREMLKQSIGKEKFLLNHVFSFKDALSELSKEKYNVVLLDLILDDVSGEENVRVISEQSPETAIIVLTGVEGELHMKRALELGAQNYLVKAYENAQALRFSIYSAIERKNYENKIFSKANFDSVTGLANYKFLCETLNLEISRAKRWKKTVTLMTLRTSFSSEDVKNAGDERANLIFKELAKRLKLCLRESDFISRSGIADFTVILDINDSCAKVGCAEVASKLIAEINKVFEINGERISLSANAGFAFYPQHGSAIEDLLEEAEKAAFRASYSGLNTYKFA